MRCGRPNSRIAAWALKNGHNLPNVMAEATKRGGIWRRANFASIVTGTCELSLLVVSGWERRGREVVLLLSVTSMADEEDVLD